MTSGYNERGLIAPDSDSCIVQTRRVRPALPESPQSPAEPAWILRRWPANAVTERLLRGHMDAANFQRPVLFDSDAFRALLPEFLRTRKGDYASPSDL